ncbi:HAMP domain-containing sensor histidine kinase [Cryptosporangium aurantiacum]|uniref:histidine kinase n=1 Tax=Cryptosporangium aurantiacum TaxID=134849 RepID=A0A1M7RN68_9ACTN|nr:HAMP domain-containing sensor histidine kinase [Cryptosporangium aurantiacum]SHN47640.1 Signal transduction histidine kinase [Cryptosporangium aurantiacum]
MSDGGRVWRSLRARLAVLGFLAGYVPVLLLFGVVLATDVDTTVTATGGAEAVTATTAQRSASVTWTVVGLAPVAAGLAWWWAGRAVRPIERIRAVAEDIQGTDLGRRIALDQGPTEVVALAASFDAMLGRLEQSADTQRRLIEETSHELRMPLAVLLTNAEVLLAHPDPTIEVYQQGLQRSRGAVIQLQATIDGLLVDARGRARVLDRRPTDVMALVAEVVADARVLAEPGELTVTGPPTAACPVDAPTVRRAIANLVDNAIRYTAFRYPPGGSDVEIAVEVTDADVAVVVTDHGPGIPTDQQNRVFERFWRGHRNPPGAGLGLPIAHQVALAHGGSLSLRSPGPAGDGCAFRLTLPRTA